MKHLLFIFLSLIIITLGKTQPGTLDKSYASDGIYLSSNLYSQNVSSCIQPDNKVLVGTNNAGFSLQYPFLLFRHNTDGSIDSSFANKGELITQFEGYQQGDGWTSIKVQSDGRIVLAGTNYKPHHYDGDGGSPNVEGDIVMARLKPDGTYDSSFGENGIVITDLGRHEAVYAMALQSDGKIVLAGISDVEINYAPQMLIVRYNKDGTLDKSFGSESGFAIYPEEADAAHAIAIQDDGRIVLGGDYSVHSEFMLLRYMPDGILDNSFGVNGKVTTRFSDNEGNALTINSLAIDKNQNIIAGGIANMGNMVVARYRSNGSLDNSFNKDGTKTLRFGTYQSGITTVELQEDGKLLLAGGAGGDAVHTSNVALARLLPDGSYDSSFGVNGQVITDFGNVERTYQAVMQSDGKAVIAGTSYKPGEYLGYFLTRFNIYDPNKQPLTVRIKRWLQHHNGISWQSSSNNIRYYTVQRSSDGITYKEVARVNSKINTYEDNTALTTTDSYYRIAAVQSDGSRTYSNIVIIGEGEQARIYPNPVRNNLQLQGLPQTGKTNLSILDLNGNVRSTATATGTNYSVNTANLNSGNYLLKIQHGNTVTTQPFVKE